MTSHYQHSRVVISFALLVLCGCNGGGVGGYGGSNGSGSGSGSGYSISITPTSSTIAINGTQQFTASSTGTLTGMTWKSSDTSVATVDSKGLATGISSGTAIITATAKYTYNTTSYAVTSNNATLTVSASGMATGTVAQGRPWVGALVVLKDMNDQKVFTTTDENGKYTLALSGLEAPYLLMARNSQGHVMFSMASEAGVANIDTYTDLITQIWFKSHGAQVENAIFSAVGLHAADKTSIHDLNAALVELLAPAIRQLGLKPDQLDFITSPFNADHTGMDELLDLTKVDIEHGQLTVVDDMKLDGVHVNFSFGTRTATLLSSRAHADAKQVLTVNFNH